MLHNSASVLAGISRWGQRGKFGESPALSRNCEAFLWTMEDGGPR